MTDPFLRSCSHNTSRFVRASFGVLAAAMILGVVGGCDAVNVRSDDASDTTTDAQASFDRADLLYEPVSLAPGETFSIELVDEQIGQGVTRLVHEGTEEGKQRLRARFDPLEPTSVTVTCRNEITGAEQTMMTLTGDALTSKAGAYTATSDDEPDSYHYIDNGDNVVVEVDYDTGDDDESKAAPAGAGIAFASAEQAVRCTHVSFALKGVSTSLSVEGVRFGGDVEAPRVRMKNLQ